MRQPAFWTSSDLPNVFLAPCHAHPHTLLTPVSQRVTNPSDLTLFTCSEWFLNFGCQAPIELGKTGKTGNAPYNLARTELGRRKTGNARYDL